jgi:hypothetical protein
VGRVGDEPVLLLDALLEPVEHRVQRRRQVRDLIGAGRHRHPLVESVYADLLCLRRHALHRQQRLARKPPAAQPGCREGRRPAEQEQEQHPLDRFVDLAQRVRDYQHVAPAEPPDRRRQCSEPLPVPAQPDRQQARVVRQRVRPHVSRHDRLCTDERSVAHEDATRRAKHLRRSVAAGEDLRAHLPHLGRAVRRVSPGDVHGALPHLPVDRPLEVRPQLEDHEHRQPHDDPRQHDGVPHGQPCADRKPHVASTRKPAPRTVRMTRSSPSPSSLRRR